MRKVMVNGWEWDDDKQEGCRDERGEAIFHAFGLEYNEEGSYSIAIVE